MPDMILAATAPVTPVRPPEAGAGNASENKATEASEGKPTFAQVLRDQRRTDSETKSEARKDGASSKTEDAASDTEPTTEPSTQASEAAAAAQLAALLASQAEVPAEAPATSEAVAEIVVTDAAPTAIATPLPANPAGNAASLAADAPVDAATQDTQSSTAATPVLAQAVDATAKADTQQAADTTADDSPVIIQPKTSEQPIKTDVVSNQASTVAVDAVTPRQDATAQVQATYAQQPATSNAQDIPSRHTVNSPVGHRGWADEVGTKVAWVANKDNGIAELVLTPPQLGRVEVKIHMEGEQASALFVAANPVAREALQDAMPRLREILSQAGIQLGEAHVSAGQSNHSGQGDQHQGQGGRRFGGDTGLSSQGDMAGLGSSRGFAGRQGVGLVDTFA